MKIKYGIDASMVTKLMQEGMSEADALEKVASYSPPEKKAVCDESGGCGLDSCCTKVD